MNIKLIPVLTFVVLAACGDKKPKHTISGQLNGAADRMVYFEHITDSGEVPLDSTMTDSEGKFVLDNKAKGLDYYMLRADESNAVFMVLSGGENVVINGESKDLENTYTISGSKDSELIRQLKKYDQYVSDSLFYIFKSAGATNPVEREELVKKAKEIYTMRMLDYSRRFLAENPTSLVSLSVTRYLDTGSREDLQRMDSLITRLRSVYPGNMYVEKFAEGLQELLALPPGSPAPEISLADTSGKVRTLSSLRGKVVLIDFWASWCAPCRKENPNVVAMYNKYKAKGFEIFGVSLDDERSKWIDAIRTDGLKWTHVSELKGWDAGVVGSYHFNGIPYTVLLDRQGRIVQKGLRGEELEAAVRAIL